MKTTLAGLMLALSLIGSASAADVKVINPDAWFPEGPIWYHDKLYYVEYGRNTVTTWDGKTNETFWKQDGCGPSAVLPTSTGEFLVTCYDNQTIGRISADGKTLPPYTKDSEGRPFIGPNDFAPDRKGGIYFTGSGHEGAVIDASVYYITPAGAVIREGTDLHNGNGLAVSNDGKILYLIETEDSRLLAFDIAEDGSLSGRRVFLRLDDMFPGQAHIYPDGVKIDAKGELYIGQSPRSLDHPGKIIVVDADAKLLRTIDVPSVSMPNLAFGPGETTLYVMALDQIDQAPYHGKVYAVPNH
ncbi:SMP-30/gluconolactonase/LRE family protein [Lichenihabitans sp. PAMC28606]|uniref:SMP-30/gluconolactonase/LRE family protein n=1 Tax=Lichenihabitans sp. PAMC28606 TaxID=2880932 RepID=UPI001D0B3934|nr:SMP-30/gluconolactonase/LRE family protein [Lichenihabitans sp. PAMC28606]UDL93725.1 SMP-30/gluconolactonase/LRE family protein [Lichenihabitans sp. PAMC28606]